MVGSKTTTGRSIRQHTYYGYWLYALGTLSDDGGYACGYGGYGGYFSDTYSLSPTARKLNFTLLTTLLEVRTISKTSVRLLDHFVESH